MVAAWNGWAIESLVQAAMVFDQPDWLESATAAGELLWRLHWVDGRLRRTSLGGVVGPAPGILEDYAALTQAFVRLASATSTLSGSTGPELLAAVIVDQFDDGSGGFYDTAADAEQLYTRPKDPTDNATPSGLSATVHALRLLSELTGDDAYAARADAAAAGGSSLVQQAPRFAGWLLADAVSRTDGTPPVQVAVVGERRRPGPRRTRPDCLPVRPGRLGDRRRGTGPAGLPAARGPPAPRRPADRVRLPALRLQTAGHLVGGADRPARRPT